MTFDDEALRECQALLRERNRGAYLSTLVLPEADSAIATVLHAFDTTCNAIVLRAPEPLAAEIRLRWWAEVVEGTRTTEAGSDPLARCLITLVEHLTHAARPLGAKVDAHIAELAQAPFPDRSELEGWAGETCAAPLRIRMVEAGSADVDGATVVGHAGCAVAIASLLRTLAARLARGQCPFPRDLCRAVGLDPNRPQADRQAILRAVEGLTALGQEHLAAMREAVPTLGRRARQVLAPDVALASLRLREAQRRPDRTADGLAPGQLKMQWALLRRYRET